MNVQVPIKKTNAHGEHYTLYQDMGFVEAVRDGHIKIYGFTESGKPYIEDEVMMWKGQVVRKKMALVEGLSAHEKLALQGLCQGRTDLILVRDVEVADV